MSINFQPSEAVKINPSGIWHRSDAELLGRSTTGQSIWQNDNETSFVIETPRSCLTGEFERNHERQIDQVVRPILGTIREFQKNVDMVCQPQQNKEYLTKLRRVTKINEKHPVRFHCFLPDLNFTKKLKDELNSVFPNTKCEADIYLLDWDRFILQLDFNS